MDPNDAVDARDLTKRFGAVTALDGVSIKVRRGEIYGLLGPNGAGKTTFLRMMFGLIRPDAGTLRVLGRSWPEHGVDTLRGVAGFVESPKFYPYLSGRRNLEVLQRLDRRTPSGRIDEVLAIVELDTRSGDRVGGYSFGMRQRLGVAAALLRDPELIVLDEPANGLDPAGIRDMRALVTRLAADGLTVLLSSHDMGEVEEVCDNVTIMQAGQLRFHGSIASLRDKAPDPQYRLTTTNDEAAAALAEGHVTITPGDGHLLINGAQTDIDRYVLNLGMHAVAVRSLSVEETSLEKMFFALTEPSTGTEERAA